MIDVPVPEELIWLLRWALFLGLFVRSSCSGETKPTLSRLIGVDANTVTFKYKDYRRKGAIRSAAKALWRRPSEKAPAQHERRTSHGDILSP